MKTREQLLKRTRVLIGLFMAGLVISGITAFPLEWEMNLLLKWTAEYLHPENPLANWIARVHEGIRETNRSYPFIAYGTDWLAFAHIVIATAFIGAIKDPVKNEWLVLFGIISCLMVFPLALIAGSIRQIPLFWQLLDCAFGALGLIPLILARGYIKQLEKLNKTQNYNESTRIKSE
ncbi:MAG: hypothetical protein ACK4ND_17250 [Cytophagaceae bacterium]